MGLRAALTADLQNFTCWSDCELPYFLPVVNNGDQFTALGRTPLNNSLYNNVTDAVIPYGFASQPEDLQPFAAENIILLTDGICTSSEKILAPNQPVRGL